MWALRAQTDKIEYSSVMRRVLEGTPNLFLREGQAVGLQLGPNDEVTGVETFFGVTFRCRAAVLTTGTFMNGRIWVGRQSMPAGRWVARTRVWCGAGQGRAGRGGRARLPARRRASSALATRVPPGFVLPTLRTRFAPTHRAGEAPSEGLTEALVALGFETDRLKTGTPARVDRRTVNFRQLEAQPGDEDVRWFSFDTSVHVERPQLACHLTRTTAATHALIREHLSETPVYGGFIGSKGPRYCPSIEDKIVRFADKDSHQVFLEPEGRDTPELYVQGFSTGLPERLQLALLHTLPGLEVRGRGADARGALQTCGPIA